MGTRFKSYIARIVDGVASAGVLVEVRGEVRTRIHPDHLYVVALTDTTDSQGRVIRAGAECVVERAHIQPAKVA